VDQAKDMQIVIVADRDGPAVRGER
jgi:hypothetical protein